mgnify:CR=1 FL=1
MNIPDLEKEVIALQSVTDERAAKVKRLRDQLTQEETELIGAKKALSDCKESLRLARARSGITHK